MKKTAFLFLAVLILSSVAFAQTDTAMLVTDIAAVDSSTASAAASKAGVPVFVAENGLVTNEIKAGIKSLGAKNVVIVGGPVVIKPEAENSLKADGYNVVRLWGHERTGTAVAVARYFWPEGSGCAVLVDDTKSSDADSRKQRMASNLAARFNCSFVPVPEGTVPADVLSLLNDLGVSEVRFVGRSATLEIREKLKQFRLKEVKGSDDEIEDEIENETARGIKKIVIVAAPDWKAAVAIAANPNEHSVVRHLTSADQSADVISFIRTHNITDVRVVGLPELAQQIADRLAAANITATKISGKKASEIAEEIVKKARTEWEEKKRAHDALKARHFAKIRNSLLDQLNDTEKELDEAGSEAETLEGTDATALSASISGSKSRVSMVRSLVQDGNFEDAKRMLAEIRYKFKEERFERKERLKIDISDDIMDEEGGITEVQSKTDKELEKIEGMLADVRKRCANTDVVDAVIERAKALRTEMQKAKDQGDYARASDLGIRARELAKIAKNMGETCRKKGEMPAGADTIAGRHGVAIEKIKEAREKAREKIEKAPAIKIKSPSDGATVEGSSITVELDAENFNLVAPANPPKAGEGHFHVYVDDTEQRGPGKKFVFENVSAGRHTIRAELHLSDHSFTDPKVVKSITVTTAMTTTERATATPKEVTVEITSAGFNSSSVKISAGDTVKFVNKDSGQHWPASAVHPSHTAYPGSGIEKCGTAEAATIFDACKGLAEGESFSFVFKEKGTWKYHDHLNSALTGRIEVE